MARDYFILFDTFNKKIISRHRSIKTAILANERFQRAVKRANGASSYIPVDLMILENGELKEMDNESHDYLYWLWGD
jgi:hypothetical protein